MDAETERLNEVRRLELRGLQERGGTLRPSQWLELITLEERDVARQITDWRTWAAQRITQLRRELAEGKSATATADDYRRAKTLRVIRGKIDGARLELEPESRLRRQLSEGITLLDRVIVEIEATFPRDDTQPKHDSGALMETKSQEALEIAWRREWKRESMTQMPSGG